MSALSERERFPLAPEIVRLLEHISTATLCGQLFRRGLHSTFLVGVSPLTQRTRMVGEAVTLRYIPSREDLDHYDAFRDYDHPQRRAIETVGPLQVLVMDTRRDVSAASAGHILATRLQVRGAAGLVTDGALRDSPAIAEMDFPVYCAGRSAALNLARHHAVDINVPIGCAGVMVMPGDVVVGDAEGVVVIPRHLAAEIAKDADALEEREEFILERVRAGAPLRGTYPPDEGTLVEYARWRSHREKRD